MIIQEFLLWHRGLIIRLVSVGVLDQSPAVSQRIQHCHRYGIGHSSDTDYPWPQAWLKRKKKKQTNMIIQSSEESSDTFIVRLYWLQEAFFLLDPSVVRFNHVSGCPEYMECNPFRNQVVIQCWSVLHSSWEEGKIFNWHINNARLCIKVKNIH